MNCVNLIGRLTKDPELRYTQSGKAVTTLRIAVNRAYNKDEADFLNIIAWGKVGENAAKYLEKGLLVGAQGRIQTRTYENSEGTRVYVFEIVANNIEFLEWSNSNVSENGDSKRDEKGRENLEDEKLIKEFNEIDEEFSDKDCPFPF